MWPFDRAASGEVLRLGALGLERWVETDGALVRTAEHRFAAGVDFLIELGPALSALYPSGANEKITLLLESAMLPAMLIDTGSAFLGSAQLDALVQHRFAQVYADAQRPLLDWEWRVEHRAGERHALAYGLGPSLKRALEEASASSGIRWVSWLPAFSWGLQRLRSTGRRLSPKGWWLWSEQDRAMVARFEANRLVGLNPGAAPLDGGTSVLRLVDVEAARLGANAQDGPIAAASWEALSKSMRTDSVVSWWCVGAAHARLRLFGVSAATAGAHA